jgi:hypothetical protein
MLETMAQLAVTQRVRMFPWPLEKNNPQAKERKAKSLKAATRKLDKAYEQRNGSAPTAPTAAEILFRQKRFEEKLDVDKAEANFQRAVLAELRRDIPGYDGQKIVFDVETTDGRWGQAMRFGVAHVIGMSYHEIQDFKFTHHRFPTREETEAVRYTVMFYHPDRLEAVDGGSYKNAIRLLRRYCDEKNYRLMTRERFNREIVFGFDYIKGKIPLPKIIIGHNLPFDIGALAIKWGLARGEDMFGALSCTLAADLIETPEAASPFRNKFDSVKIRRVGPGKHLYGWKYNDNPLLEAISFVDTVPLARALLSPPSASMGYLCDQFKYPGPDKPDHAGSHFKPLTREYVQYCEDDVDRSWFIFQKLRATWERTNLNAPLSRILSEASIGKTFLRAFGLTPFLEQNGLRVHPERDGAMAQPETVATKGYRSALFELCGVAMEAMNGAKSCVNWRHDIVRVILADFKSQYPTVNYLLGLQEILIAERVAVEHGGPDDETAQTLQTMTVDECLAGGFHTQRRALRSYVLVEQIDTYGVVRTTYRKPVPMASLDVDPDEDRKPFTDASTSINIGVNKIKHGPRLWVAGPTYLAMKFLNELEGKAPPRIIETRTIIPHGVQSDLKAVKFFGRDDYVIDLTREECFKRVIDMRSEVRADISKLKKIAANPLSDKSATLLDKVRDREARETTRNAITVLQENGDESAFKAALQIERDRLEGMQMALKLIANSTSYGVKVEFITDERKQSTPMVLYCGAEKHEIPARRRTRDSETGERETSGFKVEKPGAWFSPDGPLITAGGLLLLTLAQCLAAREGLTYAMCDTDSKAFAQHIEGALTFEEFSAKVKKITEAFEPLNPYAFIDGKRDALFKIEDANFAFTAKDGEVEIGDTLKPLYMFPISSKRYACANIERPCARSAVARDDAPGWFPNEVCEADWSDYATRDEMFTDAANAHVVLRKVSGHGLGAISAPGYGDDTSELADDEADTNDEADEDADNFSDLNEGDQVTLRKLYEGVAITHHLKDGFSTPHEAVPWSKIKGKTFFKWSEVCKGKGNPRLFCDMWRMQFHAFLKGGDKASTDILAQAKKVLRNAPGLLEPQYQQRSINTRHAVDLYGKMPHARPFGFINILPKPKPVDVGIHPLTLADRARVELLSETSLYMEGGTQNPQAMIDQGRGLHRRDNGSLPVELQEFPEAVRLSTIYDALHAYFDHCELKSRGERYELSPRTLVIQDKEYIGKETNPLDDGGIADSNAELQIEDRPAVSVLRDGFNPILHKITRERLSEIAAACGTTPRGLLDALAGKRGEYHRKAMAHYRSVFIFDEDGELVDLNLEPRKISKAAIARHEFGELARRAFFKVKSETDKEAPTQRLLGNKNPDEAEERLARLVNGSNQPRKVTPDVVLELLTEEGIREFFHESAAEVRWLRARFEAVLGVTAAREVKAAKREAQRQKRAANPNLDREYRTARRAAILAHNAHTLERAVAKIIGPPPLEVLPTVESVIAAEAWLERSRHYTAWLRHPDMQSPLHKALTTRRHAFLTLLDATRERLVDAPTRRREQTREHVRTLRARRKAQAMQTQTLSAPAWPFSPPAAFKPVSFVVAAIAE